MPRRWATSLIRVCANPPLADHVARDREDLLAPGGALRPGHETVTPSAANMSSSACTHDS